MLFLHVGGRDWIAIMLIDSHCHLDRLSLEQLGGSMDAVLENARAAGVDGMLCVSINLENYPAVLELARKYPQVYASVGVHPSETEGRDPDVAELVSQAADPAVIAIGETGLDYYYNEGDLEWQRDRFRRHIRAARSCGKPLIIHTRDAERDTLRIMAEEGADAASGVMHCFTGSVTMAQECLEMNFYISFSGIVTFKKAEELQAVAREIPADRILIETDSPYLTPVPYRGKANQPAYVRFVAEKLAQLRDTPVDRIIEQTTENFYRLFGSALSGKSSAV